MSYILDALRRADAERERGAVPSIHTQQQFTAFGGEDDAEAPSRRLGWVIAGLAAALFAAVAWILLRPAPETPVAATSRPIGGLPAAAPTLPPVLPAPAGTPPTPGAGMNPPGATGVSAALPPGAPPSLAVAPTAAPRMPTAASPAPAPRAATPSATHTPAAPAGGDESSRTARRAGRQGPAAANDGSAASERTAPAKAPPDHSTDTMPARAPDKAPAKAPDKAPDKSGAPDAERIYAQRELPDDVRRALPPIAVNGSTYSNDASSRMLMIGGQLYHEGDTVAPGVVLQRIKQRSAILAFRGYRYEMTF